MRKQSFSRWLTITVMLVMAFSPVTNAMAEEKTETKKYPVDYLYNKHALDSYNIRYPTESALAPDEISAISANGSIKKSPYLDTAFACLEEGNPFVMRYNVITTSSVQPLLSSGIPYFFGGRDMKNILSRAPEYTLWKSWQDSKYYHTDVIYFFGFDCVGFIRYVQKECGIKPYTISSNIYKDAKDHYLMHDYQIMQGDTINSTDWVSLPEILEIGDVFALFHPNLHSMMYIGTLRDYGYTESDFPNDPEILEYPLVIHSGTNALYADWFYKLKETGPGRYKKASVPDGGVSVSILGYNNSECIYSVRQQKQYTYYTLLPDGSWLTSIDLSGVTRYCWYR